MLHEKLKKLMAGKKGMSDNEKNAKMDVVSHLRDMAAGAMKDKMGSHAMHKVAVAADSAEGLKHGLDKAKQIVGQSEDSDSGDSDSPIGMSEGGDVPEHDTSDKEEAQMLHDAENPEHDALSAHEEHDPEEQEGSPEEEASESPAEEASEYDSMDEDELNKKLEQLMKSKKKKGL